MDIEIAGSLGVSGSTTSCSSVFTSVTGASYVSGVTPFSLHSRQKSSLVDTPAVGVVSAGFPGLAFDPGWCVESAAEPENRPGGITETAERFPSLVRVVIGLSVLLIHSFWIRFVSRSKHGQLDRIVLVNSSFRTNCDQYARREGRIAWWCTLVFTEMRSQICDACSIVYR